VSEVGTKDQGIGSALVAWSARHAVVLTVIPIALYVTLNLFDPLARNNFIDLDVYRAAGRAVLDRAPLYAGSVAGGLNFTYTPFAAVLFTPLALPGDVLLRILWCASEFALLVWVVRLSLVMSGRARGPLRASIALAGLVVWLEPVTWGLVVGQVNLVLLALVLWDLRDGADRRYQGLLVGLATGIKLVPGIFVLYLLVTRRFRAAGLAVVAFMVTVGVGALVRPEDSRWYWAGAFTETNRIDGSQLDRSAQSVAATLARLTGSEQPSFTLWLVMALLLLVSGLGVAAWAHLSGRRLLGLTLCGLTGCAVSPFAWSHHWVWFIPLTVMVLLWAAERGVKAVAWTTVGVAVILGAWPWGYLTGDRFGPILGTIALPLVRPWDVVYGNLYLWTLLAVLAWSAAILATGRRSTAAADTSAAPRRRGWSPGD
jgi:alpha-1,2-mannosyltransferase